MSGRPRRTIVKKEAVNWNDKWDQFAAAETKDSGDGKMDCKAILYYKAELKSTESKYTQIFGETGQGHAEMNALDDFIRNVCNSDRDTLALYCEAGAVFIECTSKPVCCRCSAILGALHIKPSSELTKKTRAPMGSTQWGGLFYAARGAIAQYLNTTDEDISTTLAAWKR